MLGDPSLLRRFYTARSSSDFVEVAVLPESYSLILDPASFARAVDERVLELPSGCDPARLFAVRQCEQRLVLIPFWSGVAREIPSWVCPPAGCVAIALETSGWAAPLDPDLSKHTRPSQHPQRRRIHHTALVHGDGDDVSVLRDGADVSVLFGAVGVVPDLMRECWERRPRE